MLQIAEADDKLKYVDTKLNESTTREKIAVQELAKMRKQKDEAERKYQELLDDTPARGARGRYIKRENAKTEE